MPSKDEQRLSDLLGIIYDAALDPTLWTAVIEQSCGFLGCMAGAIGGYDLSLQHQTVNAIWGYEEKYAATLGESLRQQSILAMSFRMKAGDVGSVVDAMPLEEFYQTPGFIQWGKPQGIVDVAQATLDRKPLALSVIGFALHERHGLVDRAFLRRLELIVPHIRRSFMIAKAINLVKVEASALGETLDGLASAVFVVDARFGLLHANRKGEAMLSAGEVFSIKGHMLEARQPEAQATLRQAIDAAGRGETAMADQGIIIPLSANGEVYAAHVLPLGYGRRAIGRSAAAAVFVRKATVDFPQPIAAVAERHALTPGQTRTLTALMAMGNVPHAAMLLGVSPSTVKTNLAGIFAKTGTARQSDLIKLVASHASPVAG